MQIFKSTPASQPAIAHESETGVLDRETALDGVRYALVTPRASCSDNHISYCPLWKVGSVDPLWREKMVNFGANPDKNVLIQLAGKGIWMNQDGSAPPLSVMCGGLGSAWPGMGRELYDNFPAARMAMDEIASVADWDVLSLMDEHELDRISPIRWQIPYLFLLEYAQWAQFKSLGLRPRLFCGHSLGELIALCLAGVYSLEAAWYILDTRAQHIAELEKMARHDTDMLVVHGDAAIVGELCSRWPDIFISNHNTARQYIISGPQESLKEARKYLRKRRIPAMMLNMGFAFHHPDMRILRSLSLRRLNALEMHAPATPVLSGITANVYPDDQEAICNLIADLDENAVRWVDSVETMWLAHGIKTFLELGPQETLCGLVEDINSNARCIPSNRKGMETEAMRRACAQLFALGYTMFPAPREHSACHSGMENIISNSTQELEKNGTPVSAGDADTGNKDFRKVVQLLSTASGLPASGISADMDLRYDLSLRSSSFPALLQEAENFFGVSANFDDLLNVTTVGDLVGIVTGKRIIKNRNIVPISRRIKTSTDCVRAHFRRPEPLLRIYPDFFLRKVSRLQMPDDPTRNGFAFGEGGVIAICAFSSFFVEKLWSGVSVFEPCLAIPESVADVGKRLDHSGANVVLIDSASSEDCLSFLENVEKNLGHIDGFFHMVETSGSDCSAALGKCLDTALKLKVKSFFLFSYVTEKILDDAMGLRKRFNVFDTNAKLLAKARCEHGMLVRNIIMLGGCEDMDYGDELGDMFAFELFCGAQENIVWGRRESIKKAIAVLGLNHASEFLLEHGREYVERDECFPLLYPDRGPVRPQEAGIFRGCCQFSSFLESEYREHDIGGFSMLPQSSMLEALVEGAIMLVPWLEASGISDVHFNQQPILPFAVTRECRVEAKALNWLIHDRVMSRLCRVTLEVRDISENGRHLADYIPAVDATVLMAGKGNSVPMLWTPYADSPGTCLLSMGHDMVDGFYMCTRRENPRRLIKSLFYAKSDNRQGDDQVCRYLADITMPASTIASGYKSRYKKTLLIVDSVVQAGMLILVSRTVPRQDSEPDFAALLNNWRLNAIGFIRFGQVAEIGDDLRIDIQLSWSDDWLMRFDAQIMNKKHEVALTVNQLEFVRNVL